MMQISATSMSFFWDEMEKIAKKEVELKPVSGFEANVASLVGSVAVGAGTTLSIKQRKPLLVSKRDIYKNLEIDKNTGKTKYMGEIRITPR